MRKIKKKNSNKELIKMRLECEILSNQIYTINLYE
jgi:hypothetical protein